MILPTKKMLRDNFLENKNKELELEITRLEKYKQSLIIEKIELREKIKQLENELLKSKYSYIISHKEQGCYGYYYCYEYIVSHIPNVDAFIKVFNAKDEEIILPTSQIINIKKL